MNRKEPLVTVVIPCFNYEDYLGDAVSSALSQTYKNIEIIIINDGSTDGSKHVAESFAKDHSNVTLLNQKNRGIIKVRNRALRESSGEYLIQLDADDMLEKNYVQETVALANNSGADIVYTNYKRFGKNIEISNFPEFSEEILRNDNYIHISSLVRKSTIKKMSFDPKLLNLTHEDWDFFLGLVVNGSKAKLCKNTYLLYRSHADSRNNLHDSVDARIRYAKTYNYVVGKYVNSFPVKFKYLSGRLFSGWILSDLNHLKEIKKAHESALGHVDALENELELIFKSKTYKFALILSRIKARLMFRKRR